MKNLSILLPSAIVVAIIAAALLADYIAPYSYSDGDILHRLEGPSREHLLGTDHMGRDILSRIIHGARIAIAFMAAVVILSVSVGITLGMLSAYFGGYIDLFFSRLAEALMSIPPILVALVLVAVLGQGLDKVLVAVVIAEIPLYFRLARGLTLVEKEKLYVEASRALGAGAARVLRHHILPNTIGPILVQATFTAATAILFEAALSFLGLGAQPPTPSWGLMLYEGKAYMRTAPHVMFFPGLAIFITVFSVNLLGEALRDRLDPRTRALLR